MELDVNYQDLTICAFERISWTDVVQEYEKVAEIHSNTPHISTLSELDRKILLDTIRSAYEHGDSHSLAESVHPGIESYLKWWHETTGKEVSVEADNQ